MAPSRFSRNPSARGSLFFDEADAQLYFGHARVASTFVAQAVSKQLHPGFQESAALNKCLFTEDEAEIGETARAREDATGALVMSPSSRDLQVCTSLVLARLGNGAEARRTALEINRKKPSGTLGDRDAARNSYQDFLTLWKDADPDLLIYKQAKAEYAKLQ